MSVIGVDNNTSEIIQCVPNSNKCSHLTYQQQLMVTSIYAIGAFGNLLALIFLFIKSIKPKNPKHAFMLRFLVTNDLIAMLGMLAQMYLQVYLPLTHSIWLCRFRVAWRTFGLGSGCVVIVMAFERWLALTKPFFYHKYISLNFVRLSVLFIWTVGLILVCLPFFGFGLYLEGNKCTRYRYAKTTKDSVYAYVYFSYGLIVCSGILVCVLKVAYSLWNERLTSKTFDKIHEYEMGRTAKQPCGTPTREELSFVTLMEILCVVFVIGWIPQLMTIPLAQIFQDQRMEKFFRVADLIMALHFVVDPFVYLFHRYA